MTTLVINEKTTVNAEGILNTKACKPVVNLTDKKIYTSILDAARIENLQPSCICRACSGKGKLSGKKKWCYLRDIDKHLDELFEENKTLHNTNKTLAMENAVLKTEIDALKKLYDPTEVAKWKAVYDHHEAKRKANEKRAQLEAQRVQITREREALEARLNALAMEMEASDLELRNLNGNGVVA